MSFYGEHKILLFLQFLLCTQEEHFLSLLVALSMVSMSDLISVLLRTHSIQGQSVCPAYTKLLHVCSHSFFCHVPPGLRLCLRASFKSSFSYALHLSDHNKQGIRCQPFFLFLLLLVILTINKFPLFHFTWSVFQYFLIMVIIAWFSRKYIGQIFTDCLVHDEKALKYLVDTIGEVRLQHFYWDRWYM